MKCKNCLSDIFDNAVYCNHCGTKNKNSLLDKWNDVYLDIPTSGTQVNINPLTYDHCKSLGVACYDTNDLYEAIEYLSFCLANPVFKVVDKDELVYINNLIGCCYMGLQNRMFDAIKFFDTALQYNIHCFTAVRNKIQCLLALDLELKAIEESKNLAISDNMVPHDWYILGVCYENTNQYSQAKFAYEKAIGLGYEKARTDLNDLIRKMQA